MIGIYKQGLMPKNKKVINAETMEEVKAGIQIRELKLCVISSSKNIVPAKGALKAADNPAATPHSINKYLSLSVR